MPASSKPRTPKAPKAAKQLKVTTVASDGLRYTRKATGSPFVSNHGSFVGSTLSCLFCGAHRKANERTTQRVCDRNHQVCNPPCAKNPKAKAAAKAVAQLAAPSGVLEALAGAATGS